MIKPFVKDYNMYIIPDTKQTFKVTCKKENYKPMYLCTYKEIKIVKQFMGEVKQIELKSKKIYDKQEALNFVLEKYSDYILNK